MDPTKPIDPDDLFRTAAASLQHASGDWPKHLLHYTKLNIFQKIVESKSIILFNPLTMNDRTEMLRGASFLAAMLTKDARAAKIINAIDAVLPGFTKEFFVFTDGRLHQDTFGSYVFCLSVPDPKHPTGLLSMWRAYGADGAGVCLAFNSEAIAASYNKVRLPVVLYPVRYEEREEFEVKVLDILALAASLAPLASARWKAGPANVLWGVYQLLLIAVATHKHPGFAEEREWRAISFATFADDNALLTKEVFTSGSSARIGLRFDLEKYANLVGVTVDNLLPEVIIGPSDHQLAAADVAVHLLESLGVANAKTRVKFCRTPYRPNK
ncbi:MAG: DUF2971 domain-containing protein [Alphaproteobacteria bacterium]|nr:DUF2971 domain-containing protein [Alphaproteobacteria bacterium]